MPCKRYVECLKCSKKGHFAKVCKSTNLQSSATYSTNSATMTYRPTLGTLNKVKNSKELLSNACLDIFINQKPVEALIDTGSTENYICGKYTKEHSLKIHPSFGIVSMASPTHTM